VVVDAAISLAGGDHPSSSPSGIAVTAAALVVMPALAAAKRAAAGRLGGRQAGSRRPGASRRRRDRPLRRPAMTTLCGVSLDAALGWWWADPVASLAVVYFAVREGREAWSGESCCGE